MDNNINSLIELRDKYTKALELKNRDYCIVHHLTVGLCSALKNNNYSLDLVHLLHELTNRGLITRQFDNRIYYWPTPKNDHLLQSRYSKVSDVNGLCLLPRIQCLDLMIKNLSDGAK